MINFKFVTDKPLNLESYRKNQNFSKIEKDNDYSSKDE